MKNKNPWIEHLNKVKKENPELTFKERVKLAKETYKKKGEEETKDYITREEFNEFEQFMGVGFLLLFGIALVIPVLYSITANTKNYIGFYGMCVIGGFCISYSFVKYLKLRKKYGKKVGMEKNSISRD